MSPLWLAAGLVNGESRRLSHSWPESLKFLTTLTPRQDVARLVVERSTIMAHLFAKPSCSTASDAVLSALLSVFSRYVRRMRKSKEGEEVYSWVRAQWAVSG